MNISQKQPQVIRGLIILLFFLIGYNGIFIPQRSRLSALKAQIEEEEKKSRILENLGELESRLRDYQNRSFASAEVSLLFDQVSGLAKSAGINLEAFNPIKVKSGQYYSEVPIKIAFSCGYHQLGEFLSLLENNAEFIWVQELKVQKAQKTEAEKPAVHKIDLTLSGLYIQK